MNTANRSPSPQAQHGTCCRSLDAGWDFKPDWRRQVIEDHLVEIASAWDRNAALQQILFREGDPYVRQGLRYRYGGRCVNQEAIAWAFRVERDNEKHGLGSRIKALVIADRFPEEIGTLLCVSPAAVVAYEELLWNVRQFLGASLWLESLVRTMEETRSASPQGIRETVWLRTALDEGWVGLERLWLRKRGTDAKALDELAREIEGIAARRTLRHLQLLEETGAPVSDDDLKRLAVLSRRSAATAPADDGSRNLKSFYERLLDLGTRNVLENQPETPKAKALELILAERMRLPIPSTVRVRRRMRAHP